MKKFIFTLLLVSWILNSASLLAQGTTIELLPLQADQLPPLEDLEEAALRWAGMNPQQIQAWERGARWSAALPRIQVGWESELVSQNTSVVQDSISVTSSGVTVGPESNRLDLDIEDNRNFEVRAVWALDGLLFNRDQLYVSREARDLFIVRSRLLEELHHSYYELKAYLVRNTQGASLLHHPLERLNLEKMTERLNSLTGGEFRRLLLKKQRKHHFTNS